MHAEFLIIHCSMRLLYDIPCKFGGASLTINAIPSNSFSSKLKPLLLLSKRVLSGTGWEYVRNLLESCIESIA